MRIVVGPHINQRIKIQVFDWLLIVGVMLAPMTALRIWKVGPGEVLCLIWGLKYLVDGKIKRSNLSFFFLLFIISLLLGALCGYFIAPSELRITDVFTWFYFGVISALLYKGLKENSLKYNDALLYCLVRTSLIWYALLYIYSVLVDESLFGIPLWYHSVRFSGGALNPHQVAVFFCSMVFVFLRQIVKRQRIIINIICSIGCIYLLWQTTSSTGKMSLVIGISVMLYFWGGKLFPSEKKSMYLIVVAFLVVLIGIIGFSYFYRLFMDWVEEDANGVGRLIIFSSFPKAFLKSPLLGLGPGEHALDGSMEFHNTYLEVFSATGILGGLVFIAFSISLIKKTVKVDWTLLPIIVALYSFGFAGFAMRRLVYWCLLSFVFVLIEQIEKSNNDLC